MRKLSRSKKTIQGVKDTILVKLPSLEGRKCVSVLPLPLPSISLTSLAVLVLHPGSFSYLGDVF